MKDILITPNATIKESLKKFNLVGEKTLIVVDDNKKLLGTLTDGDIRRHLLNTGNLEESITNIYNPNPKYIYNYESKEKAKQLMLENKIEILPIVDQDKVLISYIVWTDLFEEHIDYYRPTKKIDIPVVIMAGGKGTRLDPFTRVLPKPLLPIKDKTITEHIIDSFKKFGFYKFILILNYKGKIIESYFNTIEKDYELEFLWEDDFYGTAGSLTLLKKIQIDKFFVTNCDVILKIDYLDVLKIHNEFNADFTSISSIKHYNIPYGVVKTKEKNYIYNIEEKPDVVFQINTGVYLTNKEVINFIPEKKYYDMPQLINKLLGLNKLVLAYPINESNYLDVGQWEEYKEVLKIFKGI